MTYYVARVGFANFADGDRLTLGHWVDCSIVAIMTGTEEQVRDRILEHPGHEPGTYLLLEKNAPVVRKPALEAEVIP